MSGIAKNGIAKAGIARRGIAHLGIGGYPGALLPAAIYDLDQWMYGTDPEGILLDKISPLKVDPVPAVKDANCIHLNITNTENQRIIVDNRIDIMSTGFILSGGANREASGDAANVLAGLQAGDGTATPIVLGVLTGTGQYYTQLGGAGNRVFTSLVSAVGVDEEFEFVYDSTALTATLTVNGVSQTLTSVASISGNGDITLGISSTLATTIDWQGRTWGWKLSFPEGSIEPVILYGGQSNMDGQSQEAPPSYLVPDQQHFFTYDVRNSVIVATDDALKPLGTTDLAWSTELEIGYNLPELHTMIKYARGGSDLHTDWQPAGVDYPEFINTVKNGFDAIYARGKVPYVKCLVWIQGEDDSLTIPTGQAYEANFDTFWDAACAELHIAYHTPVVLSKLGKNYQLGNEGAVPGKQDVIDAQTSLGTRDYITAVNTDDLTYSDAYVHYDGASLVTIAERMFPAIQSITVPDSYTEWKLGMQEGYGATLYDNSGNAYDTDITGTKVTESDIAALRNAKQDSISDNHNTGFDLWTKDVGGDELRVLLRVDGTSVKGDGDTITGFTWQTKHIGCAGTTLIGNGSEVTYQQEDPDFAVFGGATFWGDGSTTWDKKTWAEVLAFVSHTTNGWFKFKSINGVCYWVAELQYPTSKALTLQEYNRNDAWKGNGSCGGGVLPFDFSFNFSSEDNSANIAAIT